MRIDILSAVPELLESPLNHSIIQRAKNKGIVDIQIHNIRDYTLNKHRKIDDYAFGFSAFKVLLASVVSCVGSEYVYQKLMKLPVTAADGTVVFSQTEEIALPKRNYCGEWTELGALPEGTYTITTELGASGDLHEAYYYNNHDNFVQQHSARQRRERQGMCCLP